jgi:hypothetical protein
MAHIGQKYVIVRRYNFCIFKRGSESPIVNFQPHFFISQNARYRPSELPIVCNFRLCLSHFPIVIHPVFQLHNIKALFAPQQH